MYQDKKRIAEDKKIAAIVERMQAATKKGYDGYQQLVEIEKPFRQEIEKIEKARRKREGVIFFEPQEPICGDW